MWVIFNTFNFLIPEAFLFADNMSFTILNWDQLSLGTNDHPRSGSLSKSQFPPFLQSPPLYHSFIHTYWSSLVFKEQCTCKYVINKLTFWFLKDTLNYKSDPKRWLLLSLSWKFKSLHKLIPLSNIIVKVSVVCWHGSDVIFRGYFVWWCIMLSYTIANKNL